MANIIKYMLFITNFLVFIMGCVVLGIGIFAIVNGAALMDLVDEANTALDKDLTLNVFTSAAIILIVVSVFVVIVTFFGCCGAIKESKCMLGTYFTIILVMFVILIVGSVIGYQASFDKISGELDETMISFLDKTKTEGENVDKGKLAITKAWNSVQEDYTCCGSNFSKTYNSWDRREPGNDADLPYPLDSNDKIVVPESCCLHVDSTKLNDCRQNPGDYNLTGCFDKFEDLIKDNKKSVLAVGVTIVVIMFFNMLFAFAMCTMAD